MGKKSIRTAVIGCGMISDIYLKNMTERFDNLEIVACCDTAPSRAAARAVAYGIESRTLEAILEDVSIELAVILTPVPTHYELIRKALEAGKHVYTEKTMTVRIEEARELVALAAQKGLYLGAAPDTFLGASLQKARKLLDAGVLGEVTSFHVCANRDLNFFTSRYPFLRLPGGGICYDYGVYYLTALVSLLGPVESVFAAVDNLHPVRVNCDPESPDYGKSFAYENESRVTALLQTRRGIPGTFTLNGESIYEDLAVFMLYGTKAVLKLACPNFFGGELEIIRYEGTTQTREILDNDLPFADNSRGIGPSEMGEAILSGRRCRTDKAMACHVLDVIGCIMESSRQKCLVSVDSCCDRPEPFG